jgi:hypothetical protein
VEILEISIPEKKVLMTFLHASTLRKAPPKILLSLNLCSIDHREWNRLNICAIIDEDFEADKVGISRAAGTLTRVSGGIVDSIAIFDTLKPLWARVQ